MAFDVEVGDTIVRMLAGTVPMELKVTKLADGLIWCGPWSFDRETGAEVDDDLKWGPAYGITGSYIAEVRRTGP